MDVQSGWAGVQPVFVMAPQATLRFPRKGMQTNKTILSYNRQAGPPLLYEVYNVNGFLDCTDKQSEIRWMS